MLKLNNIEDKNIQLGELVFDELGLSRTDILDFFYMVFCTPLKVIGIDKISTVNLYLQDIMNDHDYLMSVLLQSEYIELYIPRIDNIFGMVVKKEQNDEKIALEANILANKDNLEGYIDQGNQDFIEEEIYTDFHL